MYQSFLEFGNARYLLQAFSLTAIAVLLFLLYDSPEGANGGTWYGYATGTIGALLIVWLALFGVRKRAYESGAGTLQGWLSGHVYFGMALLVVATLHSTGELGWNVHSLAYLLMCVVIFSGFYGVYLYRVLPQKIAANLAGQGRNEIYTRIAELDRRGQRLATATLPDVQTAVSSAIERTAVLPDAYQLVLGQDRSRVLLPGADGSGSKLSGNRNQGAILAYLADQLAASRGGEETVVLRDLIDLFTERRRLLNVLRIDNRLQSRLRTWLYIHLPVTFALLVALTVHIVTVFLYW